MEIISKKPLKPGEKPSCHEIPPAATRGKPGPKGDAATMEVVGVYTIEPTDPARVENIGDKNAAKLEFYIPKGDPGNVGPAGKDGADGKDYVLTEADKQEIADLIDVKVDGVVGGYYTPEVSQVDENTMKVSFTASGDKMPPVQSTELTLPAGRDGQDGAAGQDGYTPQKNVDYFDGQDGVSPTVTVSDITGGHRITITDANGKKTTDVLDGKNGSDYVLTEADKQEIADMVDVQGGASEWKTLLDLVTEEEIESITIDTDVDGRPFDIKEVIIECRIAANASATAGPFCRFELYDANGAKSNVVQTQQGFVPKSETADYRVRAEYVDSVGLWRYETLWRSSTKYLSGTPYSAYATILDPSIKGIGSCTKIVFNARANMGVGSIIRIFGR